jgi:hypothetical protein
LQLTAGVSTLELPVRPTRPGEAPPFEIFRDRYEVPGTQPVHYRQPLEGVEISGEPGSRTFTLTEGSLQPSNERKIAGTGTAFREAYYLRRSIRENDPNSAEMEAIAINVLERGEWRIRLRARCLCKSTATHFLCSETFESWEGDRAVFSRTWDKKIPRELV